MKKILLSLVAMMIATMSFAQNTLVATLTHDDDISIYYGINAFKEAMTAAADGDVINLSGGKFNTVDITKAVTVRGTGIEDANPTILNDRFYVNIPASDSLHFTMEGIKTTTDVTINGATTTPYFIKCCIQGNVSVEENAQRVMFLSCEMNGISTNSTSTSQFISCYIDFCWGIAAKSTEFINCVLQVASNYTSGISNSNIVNSIIVKKNTGWAGFYSLPASTIPVNCISVGGGNPFADTTGSNNICELDRSIFIDSNILNDLTDEAKSKYLGYDGTPVGMYGGIMPRNMTPSYPRITKMNVAKQTTADGKLSVDIEVSAAE